MTRRSLLLLAALALVIIGVLSARVLALASVRREAAEASARLDAALRDAADDVTLRAQRPTIAAARRPAEDVLAAVRSIMADAGVPAEKLRSVDPEPETVVADNASGSAANLRRQSARVHVEPLAMPQVAALLERWRASGMLWSIGRLELTHNGPEDQYSLGLTMSAVYLAVEPAKTAPPVKNTPSTAKTPALHTAALNSSALKDDRP